MLKKLLGAISFLVVALLIVIGISTIGSRNKNENSEDNSSVSQNQKEEDQSKEENDKKDIDQVLNAFLAEGTAEQTAAKLEDDENSLVSSDSDSINNLIQTYDENEF